MKKFIAPILLALVAAAPLPAQEKKVSPLAMIPPSAWAVVQVDGPARFKQVFSRTNLAQVLGSEEVTLKLQPLIKQAEEKINGAMDEVGLSYKDLKETLLGYKGKVYFAFGLGPIDPGDMMGMMGMMSGDAPPFWTMIIMAGDGGATDLAAMANKIVDAAERKAGDDLSDLKVEGTLFRTAQNDGVAVALPAVINNHMVFYMGSDLKKTIASSMLAEEKRVAEYSGKLGSQSLSAYINVPGMVNFGEAAFKGLLPIFGEQNKDLPENISKLLRVLGVKSVRHMGISLEPVGSFLKMDMTVHVSDGDLGLMECLINTEKTPLQMVDLLPLHKGDCQANFLDLNKLYTTIHKGVSLFADQMESKPEDLEKQFEELFKVRLKQDILDNLGQEMLFYTKSGGDRSTGGGGDNLFGGAMIPEDLGRACLGLAVRDAAALDKALATLIQARGFHVSLKTVDYRGLKINTIKPFGIPLHYAVDERAFLVGFGEAGTDAIRDVLDQIADRKEGKKAPTMSKACLARRALLPADVSGISVSNLQNIMRSAFDSALNELGIEEEPEPEAIPEEGEAKKEAANSVKVYRKMLMELTNKYDIKYMVSGSYMKDGVFHSTVIW